MSEDIFEGEQRFVGDYVELRDGKVRYAKVIAHDWSGGPPRPVFEMPEIVWVWQPGIEPPKMPMGPAEVAAWWEVQNNRVFEVQELQSKQ